MKNKRIILASGSKSRQALLKALGYSFDVIVSDFDEGKVIEPNPSVRAVKIASGKGKAVAENHDGIILAADTYSVCEGKVLEKPKDAEEAKKMLNLLSENKAIGYTGFYFLNRGIDLEISKTVTTEVTFRKIYKDEIEKYVETFPVTTWAASYAPAEVYVLGMIKAIKGSLTGWAYGLPSELLVPLLAKAGHYPKP